MGVGAAVHPTQCGVPETDDAASHTLDSGPGTSNAVWCPRNKPWLYKPYSEATAM